MVVPVNRSPWQLDLPSELGELASQATHPPHDRLAAGSEPASGEAGRVSQLPERSVIVEGFGRARLPDVLERSMNTSELRQQADGGVLAGRRQDVIDELLELGPAISDPDEVAA